MQIRLINATPFFRGWKGRPPGTVLTLPDGVANGLVHRGIAKVFDAQKRKGGKRASHKR